MLLPFQSIKLAQLSRFQCRLKSLDLTESKENLHKTQDHLGKIKCLRGKSQNCLESKKKSILVRVKTVKFR